MNGRTSSGLRVEKIRRGTRESYIGYVWDSPWTKILCQWDGTGTLTRYPGKGLHPISWLDAEKLRLLLDHLK